MPGRIIQNEASTAELQLAQERLAGILENAHEEESLRRLRDLEELKKREVQLSQFQKMEAVGQLSAGIAHNFNNRLMVISTAIESMLLMERFDLATLKLAEASLDQTAGMVEQLMLFSRTTETGRCQSFRGASW